MGGFENNQKRSVQDYLPALYLVATERLRWPRPSLQNRPDSRNLLHPGG